MLGQRLKKSLATFLLGLRKSLRLLGRKLKMYSALVARYLTASKKASLLRSKQWSTQSLGA